MSSANLYNHTGKKAAKPITLPKAVFAAKINHQLIAQAVHVFRSNQSQHNSVVQTRGDVSLTTAKVYRQKGTGNARHGAKSAPIFVGGGVAHGPKSAKPARKKLNTKMRRQSLISALTHLAQNQAVSLVADLEKLSPKTKDLHSLLSQILPDPTTKTLILINKPYPNLLQAANNINNLHITRFNHTNIHQITSTHHLILDQEALDPLTLWLTHDKKPLATSASSNISSAKNKNDTIKVLSGDDKGRTGKVTKLYPKENKVLVDGLNTYKKHLKNQSDQDSGGVVTLSRPLHVSKLQLICPQCHKPTRVTYSGTGSSKVRLCSKCHKPLTTTTPKKTKK